MSDPDVHEPAAAEPDVARQSDSAVSQALVAIRLSAPVAMAYIPLGLAFGVLIVTSGISWFWAPLSALLIFAGSIEYLAVGLIVSGVPFVQVLVTAFVVNFRHVFYGLTFPLERIGGRWRKAYGVWALTDETYAITAAGPGAQLNGLQIMVLQVVSHTWWVGASLVGALVGKLIPPSIVGFGFALTAMFITLLVDSLRNHPSLFQLMAAAAAILVAVCAEALWPNWFLVCGLLFYVTVMTIRFLLTPSEKRAELW